MLNQIETFETGNDRKLSNVRMFPVNLVGAIEYLFYELVRISFHFTLSSCNNLPTNIPLATNRPDGNWKFKKEMPIYIYLLQYLFISPLKKSQNLNKDKKH